MVFTFAEERKAKILAELCDNGAVYVKELAEKFELSDDCIRKDLAALEKSGELRRTYGGAVQKRQNPHAFAVSTRTPCTPEIKKIAEKACALISGGDTIFLDVSTISVWILKELISKNTEVTVVSPMCELINIAALSVVPFFAVGGFLNKTRDAFAGASAVKTVSQFRFDAAFFGTVGMDLERGAAYTYDVDDGCLKEAALSHSRAAYLVAQSEKLYCDGNYKYANLADFDCIIMEKAPDGLAAKSELRFG